MRKLIFLVLLCLLGSCSSPTIAVPIRAVYLVEPGGQLSPDDLKNHPEILVTDRFTKFQQAAGNRVALWIDKNAIKLVDSKWLDEMPQASYPIILVGYNDTLLSFRDGLQLCCFMGPADPDYSKAEPGFSVIKRDSGEPDAQTTMLEGFRQVPTVDELLRISDDLLTGKIQPTPTLPSLNNPSPTP